jgi:hypothetical protein
METPDKEFLRQFSKIHQPEERIAVARDIKEIRRPFFERVKSIDAEIENAENGATERQSAMQNVAMELRVLGQELSEQEQGIAQMVYGALHDILKITDGISPKVEQATSALEAKELEYQKLLKAQTRFRQYIADLVSEKQNHDELDLAQERLQKFYENQKDVWNVYYGEEMHARDVRNVIGKYNIPIIHGITPDWAPLGNSLLRRGIDWETKLKIVLALQPTISTSTIMKGDGNDSYWSWIGVVINGGNVMSATASSQANQARGISDRKTGSENLDNLEKKAEQSIGEAIFNRPTRLLNELTVGKPEVAGFYLSIEAYESAKTKYASDRTGATPLEDIDRVCRELDLPLYLFKSGELFEARYDEASQSIVPVSSSPIQARDLLDKPVAISALKKEAMLEDLLYASPFNTGPAEMRMITARNHGRCDYFAWADRDKLPQIPGKQIEFSPALHVNFTDRKAGQLLHQIGIVQDIGFTIRFFDVNGRIYRERDDGPADFGRGRILRADVIDRQNRSRDYITIAGNCIQFEKKIDTFSDFCDAFKTEVLKLKDMIAKQREELQSLAPDSLWRKELESQIKHRELAVNSAPFFMFGLADQAEETGDQVIAEQAREVGRVLGDEAYYRNAVARRVTVRSPFKLSKEDLINLGAKL